MTVLKSPGLISLQEYAKAVFPYVGNGSAKKDGYPKLGHVADVQKLLAPSTDGGQSTKRREKFHQIGDQSVWMYSAYFDNFRKKLLVRLIGLAPKFAKLKVYCIFKTDEGILRYTGRVIALQVGLNRSVSFDPSFIEYTLPLKSRPTHVSVSLKETEKPTNRFLIQYPGPRIRNFTVCYSVLHSNFNMASQLIESIEMNRILGAEHFMVYNYSISSNIDQILRRYQKDGLVTVIQWPIPTLDTWYFGQEVTIQDCFYRNRNTSRFVVVVDTDELIIPRKHSSWMELINAASPRETDVSKFMKSSKFSKKRRTLTGSFMAQCTFFSSKFVIPDWKKLPSQFTFTEEEKTIISKNKLKTLSQFWREENIFPHYIRSKYIARPELVYNPGVHYVVNFTKRTIKSLNLIPNLALLYHYCRWFNESYTCVYDTGILKFKHQLYPRITEQFRKLSEIFP